MIAMVSCMKKIFFLTLMILVMMSCGDDDAMAASDEEQSEETPTASDDSTIDDYTGTGFITQGLATTTVSSLIDCASGRTAGIGTIEDDSGNTWTVPAEVNYENVSFPFASDLHNPCNGNQYQSATEALAVLDGSDIVEIDADGEVITAFVFADNYFEMYINGTPVGKDNVPFTQFNSDLIRFKVNRPFTVAMKLVDWEENLGLGSEDNRGFAFSPGDGGMVAVFKDANDDIIETTDETWKAQTFYTSPVKDLTCLSENGTERFSSSCDEEGAADGSAFYAVHWEVPTDWSQASFDDSDWPDATTYTNEIIGVDNKSAYTSFTDLFDNSTSDAQFIWSTNVVLDNEVIVRKIVE